MNIVEYADRDLASLQLADEIASGLRAHLAQEDSACLAVPGGTTPGPVFDSLSGAQLDWSRVIVMLTDERWVPEDHARSNAALVRARLLQGHAAAATFLPFYRQGATASEAAEALSQDLDPHLPLSMLMLGMGSDMHTASLFPGADGVAEAMHADARAVCAVNPADQPEPRITLSAQVLNGALEKHLIIFGDDKKQALETAMKSSHDKAPIAAVIKGGTVHWAP